MKKLGHRNFLLLSLSLKTLGWWDGVSGAMMYEEQMYAKEVSELWRFAQFLYDNRETIPFGSVNYEEAFKKFKVSENISSLKKNGEDSPSSCKWITKKITL